MDSCQNIENLENNGFCVLKHVFDDHKVTSFRRVVTDNFDQMGQTRKATHSYHLAGFHRFPAFVEMHQQFLKNRVIHDFLAGFYQKETHTAIGLSDITVNRSQHWHTDLLRGPYACHMDAVDPWERPRGDCIKALLYLQPGKSLRVLRGSHKSPTPLDDVKLEDLATRGETYQLDIETGDVVMMDIRLVHRGSTDTEMSNPALEADPKILLSTVFGRDHSPFTESMKNGNDQRMADWDARHLHA